ncbi:MAG: hypothetical protein CM15mV25_0450 [uncultured marine virus]|nr:MAG: hypothetical protein CM15mV25_0450 [uncultured marine virus]
MQNHYKDGIYYIDHHQSHAYAFLNSGYKQSDVLAIDGIVQDIDVYFLIET